MRSARDAGHEDASQKQDRRGPGEPRDVPAHLREVAGEREVALAKVEAAARLLRAEREPEGEGHLVRLRRAFGKLVRSQAAEPDRVE